MNNEFDSNDDEQSSSSPKKNITLGSSESSEKREFRGREDRPSGEFREKREFNRDRPSSDKPWEKREFKGRENRPSGEFREKREFNRDRPSSDKPWEKREFKGREDRPSGEFREKREFNRDDRRPSSDKPWEKREFRGRDDRSGSNRELGRSNYDNNAEDKGYERKPLKRKLPNPDHVPTPPKEDGTVRLNKYLANAGIGARRKVDEYITEGLVAVNSVVITEMGYRLIPGQDIVTFRDEPVAPKVHFTYILLNKPKNTITTMEDDRGRATVFDLVKDATADRIFAVGRLDRNTTGLLLLTNDGELAQKLTHPSYKIKKVYSAELDRPMEEKDLQAILTGLELEDGKAEVDTAYFTPGAATAMEVTIEIHSGKNRIVRRIFEHLGYEVVKLDRIKFGNLTKKGLARGENRSLTETEVKILKIY